MGVYCSIVMCCDVAGCVALHGHVRARARFGDMVMMRVTVRGGFAGVACACILYGNVSVCDRSPEKISCCMYLCLVSFCKLSVEKLVGDSNTKDVPDAFFVFADRFVAYDHEEECVYLVSCALENGGILKGKPHVS